MINMADTPKYFRSPRRSPNRRDASVPRRRIDAKTQSKPGRLPQQDKMFIEEILKRNMEKTIKIFKSSIPSYFSRHFRKKKSVDVNSLSSSETVNRLYSPITQQESRVVKAVSEIKTYMVHPTVSLLQISNGIELRGDINPYYTYFVGSGNNDLLIRNLLKLKPEWVKAFSPHSANFIWTDTKKSKIFELIPKLTGVKKTVIQSPMFDCGILPSEEYRALEISMILNPLKIKIYNKLEGNSELASKKKLFYNMVNYYKSINKDPFSVIPLTYHLINGSNDINFSSVVLKYKEFEEQMKKDSKLSNCWLIKPGEATNRGIGITICSSLAEIILSVDEKKVVNGTNRTYIVQKYIYRPMLYCSRKFDIRCYALVTIINGNIQAYFYKQGYLRTSCQEFSMSDTHDKFIHLTNDAVQNKSRDYGKFEDGNKLSYSRFQQYIDQGSGPKVNFQQEVYPKMREIAKDTIKATYKKLDPNKRAHCFEVLGYDFMLDEFFNPWLLEVNTNPCLELSGKYLTTLIPNMLIHTFALTLDQIFPSQNVSFEGNLYELIFSECSEPYGS